MVKKMLLVCVCVITVGVLLSCKKVEQITFNRRSVNIASPGKDWPGELVLTDTEQAAFDKLGRPDAFRIWYIRDGAFQRKMQVYRMLKSKQLHDLKWTWIYLEQDKEISFPKHKAYEETPLSDQIKLVCDYGDPEAAKKYQDRRGVLIETWSYYSLGRDYIFHDGKLVSTNEYPATGVIIER